MPGQRENWKLSEEVPHEVTGLGPEVDNTGQGPLVESTDTSTQGMIMKMHNQGRASSPTL